MHECNKILAVLYWKLNKVQSYEFVQTLSVNYLSRSHYLLVCLNLKQIKSKQNILFYLVFSTREENRDISPPCFCLVDNDKISKKYFSRQDKAYFGSLLLLYHIHFLRVLITQQLINIVLCNRRDYDIALLYTQWNIDTYSWYCACNLSARIKIV